MAKTEAGCGMRRMGSKLVRNVAAAALAGLLLAGCQSQLYSDLDERAANEMVAVLAAAGIEASRTEAGSGRFAISVDRSSLADAIAALSAKGLPRQSFGSLGEVFKSDKLVSTPFEERARFMYALNQELSDSISRIGGVASARVHIIVPEPSPFSTKAAAPRASVFIYKSAGADLSSMVPTVKNLVLNSVEGLTYDNIEVAMFDESALPAPGGAAIRATGIVWPAILLAALVSAFFLLLRFVRSVEQAGD